MVRGHDKKEKRIIKLKNKTMPKFKKNTSPAMYSSKGPFKMAGWDSGVQATFPGPTVIPNQNLAVAFGKRNIRKDTESKFYSDIPSFDRKNTYIDTFFKSNTFNPRGGFMNMNDIRKVTPDLRPLNTGAKKSGRFDNWWEA